MIHVSEHKAARRFDEYFVRQINKSEDLIQQLKTKLKVVNK